MATGSEKDPPGETNGTPNGQGRVLVVDDDDGVRRTMARVLRVAGYDVEAAENGAIALTLLGGARFDVVVSDISMPGMDGIRLLREIRARDAHVQVMLMTGSPSIDSAVSAVNFGACKYLQKPLEITVLADAVKRAVSSSRLARLESRAAAIAGNRHEQESDVVGLDVSFDRALGSAYVAYQPIVRASDGSTFGYEALVRSREPGIASAAGLLDAAQRLERLNDLGRWIRHNAPTPLEGAASEAVLFVNLHPMDLLDPELGAESVLRAMSPRVVLEITERASIHRIPDSAARVSALRAKGFRIAVDDLGAGYAGLSSFSHLSPDFVKLDMSLVRDIHENDTKRRVVAAMTALAKDLHMTVVAEGVEKEAEGEVLRSLGCDLLQGFLYAAPGPPFPTTVWPHAGRLH
jgi:EAL domain-containing protein (putative c-di-GMP-specific phosphodiesterase class I)